MTDLSRYEEFAEALEMIDDEEMRFEYIIDLGRQYERDDPFPQEWKIETNLMHGCMSKVWIVDDVDDDGRHHFRGHSDAIIVNGLVGMMTEAFSGLTGAELQTITVDHVRRLNLGALTTQRQVGMMAMLKHLQKLGRGNGAMAGAENHDDHS
ncbi:MAG: SufE family protein [Rhodospirillales bacterium]|nr:MAG: SufE family protein [Rhodospirillales bacterium]